MFGSKSTNTTVQAPTVIGEGAVIEGTMRVEGRVQIDGEIQGSLVVKGHVSIGPKGKIEGDLVADDVAVGGRVEGKVTAHKHLHVVASGVVRGDVRYATLQIDRGAVLDGRTVHGEENADEAAAKGEDDQPSAPQVSLDAEVEAMDKPRETEKGRPVPPPPAAAGTRESNDKAPNPFGVS